jgi:hypothetical protein
MTGTAPGHPLLHAALAMAVPLEIQRLRDQDDDVLADLAHRCVDIVATHGDDLLFRGSQCASAFGALVRGLAVAALIAEGGVDFVGLHWCAWPHCRARTRMDHADDDEPPGYRPNRYIDPATRELIDVIRDLADYTPTGDPT